MNRFEIIKVVTGADGGGVRTSEIEYTKELQKRDVKVSGIIIGNGDTKDTYKSLFDRSFEPGHPFPVFGGSVLKKPLNIASLLWRTFQAADYLSKNFPACDLPCVLSVRKPFLLHLSGLLSKRLDIPVLWHIPDTMNLYKRYYINYILNNYNIIPIGNSLYTLNKLGLESSDIVYPGFSKDRVVGQPQKDFKTELGISQGDVVFGMVSRLVYDKAPDIVLNAFLESKAFSEGAHLIIAGGPLESKLGSYLNDIAAKYGNGQIHLLGMIEDVKSLYHTIDIAINGRRNAEPFGISIIEAMAAGKPVIAYKAGEPSVTVVDSETGFHVEKPTKKAYRDTFDRAWEYKDKWVKMGERAKEISEYYTVEHQVSRYLEIVRRILNENDIS
ncbi:glycosyltransferase family 4 protein [Natranaerofaba carboxydovora]|uniref:glycosyltransferase family 4 protein n=1 Tax=Natranaerofaba carboxydovora TaxID=2742683 RepID=UPI001F12F3F4|nr:glycosyltransferase family 4 protein [Natranaerofaba carboxydovora]UMZ74716.1 D-inositol 3-phosphate glycosyltransferase [Natranaerofaba carboxydovora]